jgi:hypothetical protein
MGWYMTDNLINDTKYHTWVASTAASYRSPKTGYPDWGFLWMRQEQNAKVNEIKFNEMKYKIVYPVHIHTPHARHTLAWNLWLLVLSVQTTAMRNYKEIIMVQQT